MSFIPPIPPKLLLPIIMDGSMAIPGMPVEMR
jgi:hypothetical protein